MDRTDYKIKNAYEITKNYEFFIDWNGFNFLIIYGKHKNGWFIAIPNWNVCTEEGEPSDVAYNDTKIAQTHIQKIAPMYLAQAITEHWESVKEREENNND